MEQEERYIDFKENNEPECRAWLLEHADTLDLTLFDNSVLSFLIFGFFKYYKQVKGDIVNPGTLKTYRRLEPWLIRRETNNLMYGGWPQGKKANVDHYIFVLSSEVKELLNTQTLIWSGYDEESLFRGFEDPVFLRNGIMIGNVFSHEYRGVLYPDRVETPQNP